MHTCYLYMYCAHAALLIGPTYLIIRSGVFDGRIVEKLFPELVILLHRPLPQVLIGACVCVCVCACVCVCMQEYEYTAQLA